MPYLTIYTTPVSGYVTIREKSKDGIIMAEGFAPVTAYKTGQWIYYAAFSDVQGYKTPDISGGLVVSDKVRTYTYIPISPPNGENGEPPTNGVLPEEPAMLPFIIAAVAGVLAIIGVVLGLR